MAIAMATATVEEMVEVERVIMEMENMTSSTTNETEKNMAFTTKEGSEGIHSSNDFGDSTCTCTSSSLNIGWWSELLQSIQSIALFVHERVLFRKEYLSEIFGKSLFVEDDMVLVQSFE